MLFNLGQIVRVMKFVDILLFVKEPGPITSDFFQTFWDFGIRRNYIFFSLPLEGYNETIYSNHN